MVRQLAILLLMFNMSLTGSNFSVEHLELTDITNLLADTFKDVEWKPNKIEETMFMTKKSYILHIHSYYS